MATRYRYLERLRPGPLLLDQSAELGEALAWLRNWYETPTLLTQVSAYMLLLRYDYHEMLLRVLADVFPHIDISPSSYLPSWEFAFSEPTCPDERSQRKSVTVMEVSAILTMRLPYARLLDLPRQLHLMGRHGIDPVVEEECRSIQRYATQVPDSLRRCCRCVWLVMSPPRLGSYDLVYGSSSRVASGQLRHTRTRVQQRVGTPLARALRCEVFWIIP